MARMLAQDRARRKRRATTHAALYSFVDLASTSVCVHAHVLVREDTALPLYPKKDT
jgi:hypothetical protein